MSLPKLILLIGPPCSGKTTWSKEYLKENKNSVRFNRDEFRFMMKDAPILPVLDEHTITAMINLGIEESLINGRDVIVDQTNCKIRYIDKFTSRFADKADIKFKIKRESKAILKARNKERARVLKIPAIPDRIIDQMHDNQTELFDNEEFKKLIEKYGYLDA